MYAVYMFFSTGSFLCIAEPPSCSRSGGVGRRGPLERVMEPPLQGLVSIAGPRVYAFRFEAGDCWG